LGKLKSKVYLRIQTYSFFSQNFETDFVILGLSK
jgi:hypothetical protein